MSVIETDFESVIMGYPLFEKVEDKKNFFIVLGMMGAKFISLAKAAELLKISRDLLFLIDKIGFNYSFFTGLDVEIEKKAIKELMEKWKKNQQSQTPLLYFSFQKLIIFSC